MSVIDRPMTIERSAKAGFEIDVVSVDQKANMLEGEALDTFFRAASFLATSRLLNDEIDLLASDPGIADGKSRLNKLRLADFMVRGKCSKGLGKLIYSDTVVQIFPEGNSQLGLHEYRRIPGEGTFVAGKNYFDQEGYFALDLFHGRPPETTELVGFAGESRWFDLADDIISSMSPDFAIDVNQRGQDQFYHEMLMHEDRSEDLI